MTNNYPSTSQLAKFLSLLLLLSSYKSLPLSHALKFYYITVKNIYFTPINGVIPDSDEEKTLKFFQPTVYKTYCSLLECDFYFHKNNSTYVIDQDHSRADLMTTKLYKFFKWCQKEHGQIPMIPALTVLSHFLRPIAPMSKYTIYTEFFAWDNKWMFMLVRFMQGDKLCCLAVSKLIFKLNSGKTIRPVDIVKLSGYYNDKLAKVNEQRYDLIKHYVDEPKQILQLVPKL